MVKGRHSIYLNQLGFDVVGADLSENSIAIASKNSNDTYTFRHDMREPLKKSLMLFLIYSTSFGYFEMMMII